MTFTSHHARNVASVLAYANVRKKKKERQMPVEKWDNCEYCGKYILLWSNGKWYDGSNRIECAQVDNQGQHLPISQSLELVDQSERSRA
jgi:hypothetical protein